MNGIQYVYHFVCVYIVRCVCVYVCVRFEHEKLSLQAKLTSEFCSLLKVARLSEETGALEQQQNFHTNLQQ